MHDLASWGFAAHDPINVITDPIGRVDQQDTDALQDVAALNTIETMAQQCSDRWYCRPEFLGDTGEVVT
ncbi:MAG: hypothetical protein ACE360_17380 [Hyphomicrobiales bacterium]